MELYAGIDLHSTNNYIGIIDDQAEKLYSKKLPNDMEMVLKVLKPYKDNLKGVVVESTYNWYWLVDGLQKNDYRIHLANPSAIKQYEGLKHSNDKTDAFWLAQMLRLNILPEGYIYPKEERPVRDLLRKRLFFVKQRTAQILSLQGIIARNLGTRYTGSQIKRFRKKDAGELFQQQHLIFTAERFIEAISFFSEEIMLIEKEVKRHVRLREEFKALHTIPGVGDILSLTIMLEVGDITRFPTPGKYASYCRCVRSERISNEKRKGKGNEKNGNKYLSWAYVEAANYALRYCPEAGRFYQRKMAKKGRVVAIKALAHKLARASYYIMRDQVAYDAGKLFRR